MTHLQRCHVVGACVDGHVVIIEFEYANEDCVWKEVNQWSSFVTGGVQGICLLNFFDKDQYQFSFDGGGVDEVDCGEKGGLLSASAFIVNGRDGDVLFQLTISVDDTKERLVLTSNVRSSRLLRQSKRRDQICAVHPLFMSQQGALGRSGGHTFVDNFLWISSEASSGTNYEDDLSLCIGSKSIFHHSSSPVAVSTLTRRVSFRILKMILLDNPMPSQAPDCNPGHQNARFLIMYSYISSSCAGAGAGAGAGGDAPNFSTSARTSISTSTRVGVQILDCDTLSTVWEYSPLLQYDIESPVMRADVENTVVNIALAPRCRHVPPSVQTFSDTPSSNKIHFSFIIFHSYHQSSISCPSMKEGNHVMCSLYCGTSCE
jgi:hypothetical protein